VFIINIFCSYFFTTSSFHKTSEKNINFVGHHHGEAQLLLLLLPPTEMEVEKMLSGETWCVITPYLMQHALLEVAEASSDLVRMSSADFQEFFTNTSGKLV
jgi:hypothetical protein